MYPTSALLLLPLCCALLSPVPVCADESSSREKLAERLREASVAVEFQYEASSGPASLLLAHRAQCANCHVMDTATTPTPGPSNGLSISPSSGGNPTNEPKPERNPTSPATGPAAASDFAESVTGLFAGQMLRPPVTRHATGVLLADGRTIVTADPIASPIQSVSVKRAEGGRIAARPLARWPAGRLLFLRTETELTGGLTPSEQSVPLGRNALAGIVAASGPFRISQGYVTAVDVIADNAEPRIELDLHGAQNLSGVPIVDADGSLIGIIQSADDGAPAIAITGETLARLRQQLPAEPQDTPPSLTLPLPWIGVTLTEVDGSIVAGQMPESSPAAKAGLQVGDVIEAVDGQPVESVQQLLAIVRKSLIDEKLLIGILRDESRQQIRVTLGQRPPMELPATADSAELTSGCPALHGQNLWHDLMLNAPHGHDMLNDYRVYGQGPRAADGFSQFQFYPGLTVVPSGPSDKKLNDLARKLEELSTSLKELSQEVQSLRK